MSHERPRRTHSLTIVATAAILTLPSGAALAHAWNYSLTAGASSGYDYGVIEPAFRTYTARVNEPAFGTNTASFGPGFLVTGAAARPLTRHASLVLSGGYRRYSKALGVVGIPEVPPTTADLRAEYFSIGAGLRIESRQGSGLYMQVLPALFVSRWGETRVDHEGWDMMTGAWQARTTHTDSFESALPGIELSAGFRARLSSALGTDFGLRFTRSADLGEQALGGFFSGDFQGLNEFALVGGITWSP